MSKKITFIGAGSYGFTYKLVCDILAKQELFSCDLSFMDVDPERLKNVEILTRAHFQRTGYQGRVVYTSSMEEALEGADFVINLVKIGFLEASVLDMDIPKKYGLYQTIGDTCGIAGVSRGLRTMVFNESLLQTMEKVSNPKAVVLNYTNPQPMSVMHADAVSKIPFIGLCHSVQGTTMNMARYVNVPYEDVAYEAAGINHLSFITRFEDKDGNDLYPKFKEAARKELLEGEDDQVFAKFGRTRIDLMERTGYMVTESSQHLSEYVPYYLRTQKLRERYALQIDRYKKNIAEKEKRYQELVEKALKGELPESEESVEYGSQIIHAMVTGVPCRIYANVINHELITNLPDYACVEVACLVDRNGVHPCRYGEMPWFPAALCSMEISVHKLAVEAVLRRDPAYVRWAYLADPVAHSILEPDQIDQIANEIMKAQEAYLTGFSG